MHKQISGRQATDICLANHLLRAFVNTDSNMAGLGNFLARPDAPEKGQYGKVLYSREDSPAAIRRELGKFMNQGLSLPIMAVGRQPGHEPRDDEGTFCITDRETYLMDTSETPTYDEEISLTCHVNYVNLNYIIQFFADNMDAIDNWTDLMAFFLMCEMYDGTGDLVGTGLTFQVPYEIRIPAGAVVGAEDKPEHYDYYWVHCRIIADEPGRGFPFDDIPLKDLSPEANFGVSLDLRVSTAVVMGENARVSSDVLTELGEVAIRGNRP
ncbi:MAG: hypothetical protein GY866_36495 [Proteobacteria bacterium]|nr:hypothetical protein [Pseudomonadota bacterium]